MLITSIAVLVCAPSAWAQTISIELNTDRRYDPGHQYWVFDGTYVTGEFDMGSGSGTVRAAVSDLDLSRNPEDMVDGRGGMSFFCKGDLNCVSFTPTGGPKGPQLPGSVAPRAGMTTYMQGFCSPSDCLAFARAVRDAAAGVSRPATVNRVPQPTNIPPAPKVPTAQEQARDLLDRSKKLQQCIAAMSTYSAGSPAELPPGCLSPTEQLSVYRTMPRPSAPASANPEVVIDGSNIPSQINFPAGSIDRVFVGPPAPKPSDQPIPRTPTDPNASPNTPSTTLSPEYRSTPSPLPPPGTSPSNGRSASASTSDSQGPMTKLEVAPSHPTEPSWLSRVFDRLGIGAPPPGPMHQPGAPDDTLQNHQADMDKATNGWNLINFLKYPLEIQRVVTDKIERILIPAPPEIK